MAYQPITYGVASPLGTNSTTTNLVGGTTFTGTAENVLIYSNIKINVFSSSASAIDGLVFQQSEDGINWLSLGDAYTIPANILKTFSIAANMRFFRVLYTNGATLTTTFLIHVVYHTNDKQPSSVRPQDNRSNDNDFVEMISALIGYNSLTDSWNRVGITSGNLGGNETLLDRLKVNASLRLLDTSLPVGQQLVGATGTQALGLTVNIVDRATRLLGVLSTGTNTIGAVNVNGTVSVSGTFFQTTQPVSLATNTPDVTDRAVRQLGITSIKGLAIAAQTTNFAAAGVGSTVGLDVSAAANVTFTVKNTVAATAFTGAPVIIFEQSDDNVSWALLSVVRNDTNLSASTHTLPANTANTSFMFDTAAEGIAFVRARVTTGTATGGMTIVAQPGSMPFSPSVTTILNPETTKVIGTVVQQSLVKGTQGLTGVTTQDIKDAGRNQVHYYTLIPVLSTAVDTLQLLTGTKGNATVAATTTPAVVTTGKILRITRLAVSYVATAASGYGLVRLRYNPAGVVAITSPISATITVGAPTPATANSVGSEEATFSEGIEFAAGAGIGISVQGFAAVTGTAVGYVLVSVTGYEY